MHIDEHTFIHASGDVTSYLAAGPTNGHLIVLCHGWPAIAKTWVPQMEAFASLGYRVIAPDMPGYGKSTVSKVAEHYALRNVNRIMAELLEHCGRDQAIWIGHDWGAVAVWSFAAHFPEKTTAVAGLARPYHTLELGLEEVLKVVNRDVFPEAEYPYGQYDYQVFFEQSFEKATSWFDADPAGVVRAVYAKGNPKEVGKPGMTSTVTRDGGWLHGSPVPPPSLRAIPEAALCISEEICNEVGEAMKRTGFRGANAWYLNHKDNRAYSLGESKHGGHLHMPVLFIGANWDPISDVSISSIAGAQKEYCGQLTEAYLDAGHWVALEKPHEVNALIVEWLVKSVSKTWPCNA